jgi:WD40 repeat protein/DNA-binding SARP family transcriptional activator
MTIMTPDDGALVEWRVLCPVGVWVAGRPVAMGGSAQRLLALLLAAPGHAASMAAIVDGLWGDDPPAGADSAIQSYVSRLRRSLTESGLDGAALVVTRPQGYLLAVDSGAVDASQFVDLIAEGRHALHVGQSALAAARIASALTLWRGDPYGGIGDVPFAVPERLRLNEARLDAIELSIAARMAGGAAAELCDELDGLVTRHPHREQLWAALMTACYRAGRQADALETYRRARLMLADDLGVEPGPVLRRVQRAVLDHDPALLRPPVVEHVELPAPARLAGSLFVGRERELGMLTEALDATACRGSRTVWLIGPGGSGKSRLVAEFARRAAARGVTVTYGRSQLSGTGLHLHVLDETAQTIASGGCVLTVVIGPCAPGGTFTIEVERLDSAAITEIATMYRADASAVIAAADGLPGLAHDYSRRLAHASAAVRIAELADDDAVRDALSAASVDLAGAVAELIAVRRTHALAAGPDAGLAPYKGLGRFEPADADVFFGRDDLTASLVARLARHGLLAVVGASGVGKSSVVAAGLVPALMSGALPGSADWRLLSATPTRVNVAEMATFTTRSSGVIVIDQFEEAYTGLTRAERHELIGALCDAVASGNRCVLTIRSDFYGLIADNHELAALVMANSVLVGAMTPAEIREAVTSPARAVGLTAEKDFVDAIVADMRGQEQALPLLSTALFAVWEQRTGSRLTLEAYEKSGGVSAAVEQLAESAYLRLSPVEAEAARRILVRLADTGDDGQLVRRRVPREDLVAAADEAAERALAVLAAGRLVTLDAGAVEVSHEAVLTRWPRLAGWLADDSAGLVLRNRLVPAVRDWQAAGREPSQLWSGPRLAAAIDWAVEHPSSLTGDESAFLSASLDAQTAGQRRQRRAQRRLRILAGAMAVALVAAVIAGGLATRARNAAAAAGVLADARRLGAQALVERDIRKAMLEAVAGVRLHDSWETRGNLLATLQRTPSLRAAAGFDDGDRILAMALRPDGREFAVGTAAGQIRVYDNATMRVVANMRRADRRAIFRLQYRADGSLMTWGDRPVSPTDSSLQMWDVVHRRQLVAPQVDGALRGGAIAVDGSLIAIERSASAVVRISTGGIAPVGVTATDHNPVAVSADSQPRDADALAVSADGRILAVGGLQPFTLVNLSTGGRRVLGAGFPLAFSPDSTRVATDAGTGDIDVWDVSTGALVATARAQAGQIDDAAWSADGKSLVTCGDDRLVRIWSMPVGNASAATLTDTFAGHAGRITACRFALDASTVYSAGLDGAVYVWDVRHRSSLGSLVRPANAKESNLYFRAFPLGDDSIVTVAPHDNFAAVTLRRLDVRTGAMSPTAATIREADSFNDFAATPDGATIASVSYTGALSTWSSRDGRRLSGPFRPALPDNLIGSAVGISDDGRLALVALYDPHLPGESRVYRYDLAARQLDGIMDAGWVGTLAFSPDRRYAVAALTDGRALVWRTDTWKRVSVLTGQLSGYGAAVLEFSDDGRYLAIGGTQGRPSMWNVGTWSLAWRAETGHNGFTTSLVFSPDGNLLVSSGTDAKTFLYETTTGRQVGGALGPDVNLWTISRFLGRTSTLASFGLDDGSVRHTDIDPAEWQRWACSLAGRELTEPEWRTLVPDQPFQHVCPPQSR